MFVWDAATGATTRLTDGDADSAYPDVSDDGRNVAFSSSASNLLPGETSEPGIFVWDATTGATTRATGLGIPRISGGGRYLTFYSLAADLVPDDTDDPDAVQDIFLWRRCN